MINIKPYEISSTRISSNAFSAQYTALILILLTFVIGAFHLDNSSKPQVHATIEQLKSKIPLPGLFSTNSELRLHSLDPLVFVLKNHDLKAKIKIPSVNPNSIQSAISIFEYLEAGGIPPASFQVIVIPRDIIPNVELTNMEAD